MSRFKALGALLAVWLILATPNAGAAGRDTHLFISDLHMNQDVPWSWLRQHISTVAQFLNETAARDDVAELTILGDLFDDWVLPHDQDPSATFESIITAEDNQPIVTALQGLCTDPDITVNYITGNHDLLSFQEANETVVAQYFQGINIVSESPGYGYYGLDEMIYGEHGNRYTICNSPDVWSWSPQESQLPLGYFITRTVTKDQTGGERTAYPDVMAQMIKRGLGLWGAPTAYEQAGYAATVNSNGADFSVNGEWWEGVLKNLLDDLIKYTPGLVNDITEWAYLALAAVEGMFLGDQYTLDGLDDFFSDPSVWTVDQRYKTLISYWSQRQNIVDPGTAIIGDLGYLDLAAEYLMANTATLPFSPRAVLFGHTHIPYFKQYEDGTVYANSGTWIDGKPCTYIEIEAGSGYDVTLWQYADKDGTKDLQILGQGTLATQ